MSLDRIEESMRNIEALKDYPRLLRERNESVDVIAKQGKQLEDQQKVIEEQSEVIDQQRRKIEDSKKKAKELREANERLKNSSETSEANNDKLTIRVKELESQRTTAEGKTLPEIETIMLEREKAAIETRANELYEQHKTEWNTNERPKEVTTEALKQLRIITDELRKDPPHTFTKELEELGVPMLVEEAIEREVQRKVNDEFKRRVDDASTKMATAKVEVLRRTEWQRFLKENVEPRASALTADIRDNVIAVLANREFFVTCDKCRMEQTMGARTAEGMADLLRQGHMIVECGSETCEDWGSRRHRIRVPLAQLLQSLLELRGSG